MTLFWFLTLVVLCFIHETTAISCNSSWTIVHVSDFVPIQSANYPQNVFNNVSTCRFLFVPVEPVQSVYIVWTTVNLDSFGLWNDDRHFKGPISNPITFQFNGKSYFETNSSHHSIWQGFTGYVIPVYKDFCQYPTFAALLTNSEFQVFLNLSSMHKTVNCSVVYRTLPGYGFKIVVLGMSLRSGSMFEAKNGSGHIVLKEHADGGYYEPLSDYLIYSADNELSLHYFVPESTITGNPPVFRMLIGIVEHAPKQPVHACVVHSDSAPTYNWRTRPTADGCYEANSECLLTLSTRTGTQMFFFFLSFQLEPIADSVELSVAGGPWQLVGAYENTLQTVMLSSKSRSLQFRFHSDGSIQRLGFEMATLLIECKCSSSKIVVPCLGGIDYHVAHEFAAFYCAGMLCNFTFEMESGCARRLLRLKTHGCYIMAETRLVTADGWSLNIIDASVLVEMDYNATLIFRSTETEDGIFRAGELTISVAAKPAPMVVDLVLDQSVTSLVYDLSSLPTNAFLRIRLADALLGDIIEVTFDNIDYSTLTLYHFEGDRFFFLRRLAELGVGDSLQLNYSAIGIYQEFKAAFARRTVIFARALQASQRHCLFPISMHEMMYGSELVAIAHTTGTCPLFVLSTFPSCIVQLSSLWTNADGPIRITNLWNPRTPVTSLTATELSEIRVLAQGAVLQFEIPPGTSFSVAMNGEVQNSVISCTKFAALLSYSSGDYANQFFKLDAGIGVMVTLLSANDCVVFLQFDSQNVTLMDPIFVTDNFSIQFSDLSTKLATATVSVRATKLP